MINIEPKIVNSAYLRISYYHKSRKDLVEWFKPGSKYDIIYCSSIFSYTDKTFLKNLENVVKGGSGFDLTTKLPEEIENSLYDWSIYPNCYFSMLWFSTGCIRNCKFCIVPVKEGKITPVEPKNLNPQGRHIKVMDNNFFANPEWYNAYIYLKQFKQPLDFQGIDVRLLDQEHCKVLNSFKHYRQIKIAWDNPKENLISKIEFMTKYVKPYKIMCYILVGFDSTFEEDVYRVESLRKLKITPFIMIYNNRRDIPILRDYARYVNRQWFFKSMSFKDYLIKIKKGKKGDSGNYKLHL
jgi:hypothetical protein